MNDKHFLPPEDRRLADQLESLAKGIAPRADFERELEKRLMQPQTPEPKQGFFARAMPALSLTVGLILLAVILNFAIQSLLPNPPQPAAGNTPAPTLGILLPGDTPAPVGEAYERFGQTLYLQAELPDGPAQAFVFNYLPPQPATRESARALADQLGLVGPLYGGGGSFLLVDGNRRLRIQSDQYFEYLPDYPRYPRWSLLGNSPATVPANAAGQIQQFLAANGFQFDYQILPNEMYGGYFAAPLTPDGHPICYEYFRCAGLLITLDEQGILSVDGDLPAYETVGQYEIISAEEAFQRLLNTSGEAGMLEGMHSPGGVASTWYRAYPANQTVTFYGWLNAIPSADGGAPLVLLDGYPATGNVSNVQGLQSYAEARGQFHQENGAVTFQVESWRPHPDFLEGLTGAIRKRPDGQGVLNTTEGETLLLPDLPADLPLPLEDAFVLGVRQGETFEWKSIDLRNVQGGGGGGGGGLGFYKLNLTGTPVPFPAPESAPQSGGGGGSGGQTYVVQEGDTCRKIASLFNISAEELTAFNDMPTDCSTLTVGQTLYIPAPNSPAPQIVEGLRGTLSITIYRYADGSQRVDYNFFNNGTPYPSLPLEGENLESLQVWQNRPVDVWGTIEMKDGAPVLTVERYEIPFPNLQFQILRGRQQTLTLEGQQVTLFTANGQTYAQLTPDGFYPDGSTVGQANDEVQIEALIVPGETFGGYPALRVFTASTASSGSPDLAVTAGQIYVVDLANAPADYTPPAMTIERVQLVYYMPDPRNIQGEPGPDQRYIQPAWMFTGHYSDGSEFFYLVQALQREFLLPEPAPLTQPG